ncbi:DNA polymerase beta superfamily protein [Nitrospirillum sp. BR 11163]|uniref:DNA polymerase beta superfamily protein n=1 Tax=Nitrospirillum sp. BR 11163 TaxID=3104323 RepID=UPI002AFE809F|nr:nucleotidyltransferase domain-containing protein [Nitrospirillum sp. BR 11163]MEA1675995.1 nucleotidyltransferase domain-containing protein [Nitrospirillum sp. BR 11163]
MTDLIVDMRFGSHLYGTATASSDLDYKAVYLPQGRDILLGRIRGSVMLLPPKPNGEKNGPGDVDHEAYSLQRYLELVAEGQPVAFDMLFAPEAAMMRAPSPLWREIQANSHRLVSRQAKSFLRYGRQQATKFSLRGARVITAQRGLAVLEAAEATYGALARLGEARADLTDYVANVQDAALLDLASANGQPLTHLEVCGKRVPFSASIRTAREIVQRLVADYGQRALLAARNDGVDWKGMSHAVRIGREALELFDTGRIVFPLAYAPEILAIKRGERSYDAVAAAIEALLAEVEAAAARSTLPDEPDKMFIEDLVVRSHRAKVLEAV